MRERKRRKLEQRNFFSLPCAQQFSDAPMPGGGEYISDRLTAARAGGFAVVRDRHRPAW
jgi:hypothetical protein